MENRLKVKETLALLLSVGLVVPIWGTFHSVICIETTWPAFASSALFFAANSTIKDSGHIAFGHVIGVAWGVIFLNILNLPKLQLYNSNLVLFIKLSALGMLAVVVTNIGFPFLSHLPSLFSGWAITVGGLGNIALENWGSMPVDILLSTLAGVVIIGIGISFIQALLLKRVFD